jgi:hypothetical protein
MTTTQLTDDCFRTRIALAGRHVDRGEWAAGSALAKRLLECARIGGSCSMSENCACAAEMLLCDIRRMLAH